MMSKLRTRRGERADYYSKRNNKIEDINPFL